MYEPPIKLYMTDIQTQIIKNQEEQILKAVQSVAVDVDHEELFRALNYDREQYYKGYADGRNDALADLVRCKDCIYATAEDGDLYCDGPIGIFGTVGFNDFCSYGERKDNE